MTEPLAMDLQGLMDGVSLGDPQDCMEREGTQKTHPLTQSVETQVQTTMRSLEDWEQFWQFSINQFHHDRPSMTEWEDSWSFCSFHHENWVRHQPNQYEPLVFKARKWLHFVSCNLSRQLEPPTIKESFPLQEWNKSWKTQRSDGKELHDSELLHLIIKELLQVPGCVVSHSFSEVNLPTHHACRLT